MARANFLSYPHQNDYNSFDHHHGRNSRSENVQSTIHTIQHDIKSQVKMDTIGKNTLEGATDSKVHSSYDKPKMSTSFNPKNSSLIEKNNSKELKQKE